MADRIITVTDVSVVTNDTLASYNNYTNQPSADTSLGSMTIGEAAAGKTVALTDGLVHEVTTKPVGTTNGEFSAVVSNAVSVDLSGGGAITDISTVTATGKTLDLSADLVGNAIPTMRFSDSGDSLIVTDNGVNIYTYPLSVANDITSAGSVSIFSPNTLANIANLSNISGLCFNATGTKVFLTTAAVTAIYSANLSTPYDISSMVDETLGIFNYPALANGRSVSVSADGADLIATGGNNIIRKGTMSTPEDISSYTEDNTLDVTSTDTMRYFDVNSDGTIIFFYGQDTDSIYQINLSTPWDLSTAQAITLSKSAGTDGGVSLSNDGSKIYHGDNTSKIITEYA